MRNRLTAIGIISILASVVSACSGSGEASDGLTTPGAPPNSTESPLLLLASVDVG